MRAYPAIYFPLGHTNDLAIGARFDQIDDVPSDSLRRLHYRFFFLLFLMRFTPRALARFSVMYSCNMPTISE